MYFRKSATHKMMDLLAIRDHSIIEIQNKLKEREYSKEEIAQALEYGKKHNWLPDTPEKNLELSNKFARSLGKKGKGQNAINQKLKSIGLPSVKLDLESEMEKALILLERKYREENLKDIKVKSRAVRFLAGKGFSQDCIMKSLRTFQSNVQKAHTQKDLE